MPTNPTYPGVYIEEIPSGVHTITGVATSIAAFFGQAKEGPVNKAKRLLSYSDFQRTFGDPHPDSELATSVRMFFQNGGTDCYVVRLVEKDTGTKAAIIVKNEALADVLKFETKEIGTWGNEVVLEVDYNTPHPEDTYHLRIFRIGSDGRVKASEEFLNCSADPDNPRFAPKLVTSNSKLVDCTHTQATDTAYKALVPAAGNAGYSESRRSFTDNAAGRDLLQSLIKTGSSTTKFNITVDGLGPYEVDLENAFAAGSTEAAIKTAIKGRINTALPATLNDKVTVDYIAGPTGRKVLTFKSATTEAKSVVIQPASAKDLTVKLMLGADQGGIERSRFSRLRPAPTGIFFDLYTRLNTVANLAQDHFSTITVDGNEVNLLTSLVNYATLNLPDVMPPTSAPNKWYIGKEDSSTANHDGVREKFAIIAAAINNESIGWKATVAGSRLLLKKTSGPAHYSATVETGPVHDIGSYFRPNTRYYSLGTGIGAYHGAKTSGAEGNPPLPGDYKGSELEHTGFYALDLIDLFNLMIIPKDAKLSEENYRSLWGPASIYCQNHRAFLIIDPPDSWSEAYSKVTDAAKGIKKLRIGAVKENAAVYYPRIMFRENSIMKTVGAAGAIAGLMSRTDSERGVWKAPAGVGADILGISDLDLKLTDPENGVLNKEGVNCLRIFPSGIVCWGARTLAGADDFGSEWKYVPIRRLALFIEESLFRGTKWVVFEPNDEPLWAKIRLNVGAFMKRLFRQGAFQGSTPDKAFFVKCDADTTPQADRDLGIVNIEVGFAH